MYFLCYSVDMTDTDFRNNYRTHDPFKVSSVGRPTLEEIEVGQQLRRTQKEERRRRVRTPVGRAVLLGIGLITGITGKALLPEGHTTSVESSATYMPTEAQKGAVGYATAHQASTSSESERPQFRFKAVKYDNPSLLAQELTDNKRDEAKVVAELVAEETDGVMLPGHGYHVDQDLVHPDAGTRFDPNLPQSD